MLTVLLPYPPSKNRLRRIFRNRIIKSAVYREWITEGAAMLARQEMPGCPIDYPVSVEMAVGRPDRRKRDVHNLPEPIFDLLETGGVLEDDSLIHRLNLYWDTSGDVHGVQVTLMAIGEA